MNELMVTYLLIIPLVLGHEYEMLDLPQYLSGGGGGGTFLPREFPYQASPDKGHPYHWSKNRIVLHPNIPQIQAAATEEEESSDFAHIIERLMLPQRKIPRPNTEIDNKQHNPKAFTKPHMDEYEITYHKHSQGALSSKRYKHDVSHSGSHIEHYGYSHVPGLYVEYDVTGNDFPNPRTELARCGMGNTQNNFVCNPDVVITSDQAIQLNEKIVEILKKAPCQCSKQCSSGPTRGRFSIGLALPKYVRDSVLDIYSCENSKESQMRAATFSNNLLVNHWRNLQTCDDGLIITVVKDDLVNVIQTGDKTRRKLSEDCLRVIYDKTRQWFDRGEVYEGLDNLLDYIRNALHGGKCGTRTGMSASQIAGIVCGVIFGVLFIIMIIVVCVGFFRNWQCVVGTCIGMVIGAILRFFQMLINRLVFRCMQAMCGRCQELVPCAPCEGCAENCMCEPLTCVDDVEAGGGGGGGW